MAHWLVVFGILGACKSGVAEFYDNHTFLRFVPESTPEFDAVRHFNLDKEIEVLKHSRGVNDSLDVLVPPDKLLIVQGYALSHNLSLVDKKDDYGRRFVEERTPKRRFQGNPAFEYKSFDAITKAIDNFEAGFGYLMKQQTLGKSFEGRKMKLVRISSNPLANNPIIFIDAGIHAREWASSAMALYLIHRLVTDPLSQEDLDGVDWYILPMVNPDGYEFSRRSGSNRMWRKTRSRQTSGCYGVDGNRNYGFKWAVSGVSHNPCDKETYAGAKAFSEPETRLVRKVMLENAGRIKMYISLHAYGQYLVYPWGYTGDSLPRTWQKLDRMAKIASKAVVAAGGPPFKVLSAGNWYPAAGGSDDFAFGAVGVPYSYTMEITDGHEFIYPESKLASTLPPLYQAFRAMGKEIKSEFSQRRVKRSLLDSDMSYELLHQQMSPMIDEIEPHP